MRWLVTILLSILLLAAERNAWSDSERTECMPQTGTSTNQEMFMDVGEAASAELYEGYWEYRIGGQVELRPR